MSATVKSQGFSLPEVMLAMFLMVSVVTALGGILSRAGGGRLAASAISSAVALRLGANAASGGDVT